MSACTCAVAPSPIVTIVMTAATPMTMPRMVSDERSTLRRISRSASSDGVPEHQAALRTRHVGFVALDDAVAEAHDAARPGGDVGLVRDHRDRDAALLVERRQQFHDLGAGRGVEVAGRLVGEQHLRRRDDGARDRDALLLAARELARHVRFATGETDFVQRLARARVPLLGRHVPVDQRQLDVLERGGAAQQIEALEHEAQVVAAQQRALIGVHLADGDAEEAIRAGGRRIEAAEDVHAGGLARAARPHHRDELAGTNAQVDAAQRAHFALAFAVDLGDLRQLDDRRRRCRHAGHDFAASVSTMTFVPGSSLRSSACLNAAITRHAPAAFGSGPELEHLRIAAVGRARPEHDQRGLAVFQDPRAAECAAAPADC